MSLELYKRLWKPSWKFFYKFDDFLQNCGTRIYFIAYCEEKFNSQLLLDYISAIIT